MAPKSDTSPRKRHLIIAGTGRAGTTFLVRYLTAMGLDTHLSRRGENAWLDEQAQAGLEDFPLDPAADDLPYVIKNPMLYEFVDQLVSGGTIGIDGVIIPVRNLHEATVSRMVLERRSMYEHLPWLAHMDKSWETSGNVPGGLIHSLSALDEARTLSMGFHVLLERLVRADIPMVFLDFPRIIHDSDYLFEKLKAFLPPSATLATARDVHLALADPQKVRIEREIAQEGLDEETDRLALRRELARLRLLNARLEPKAKLAEEQRALIASFASVRAQVDELEQLRRRWWNESNRLQAELDASKELFADLSRKHDELQSRDTLLAAQLEIQMSERSALDEHCHRLEAAEADARRRAQEAERSLHEHLVASEQNGSLRQPEVMLLKQLETANAELATTRHRISMFETPPDGDPFAQVKAGVRRVLGRFRNSR